MIYSTTNMIQNKTNSSNNEKKTPRRKLYQDVKFTNLLHSTNKSLLAGECDEKSINGQESFGEPQISTINLLNKNGQVEALETSIQSSTVTVNNNQSCDFLFQLREKPKNYLNFDQNSCQKDSQLNEQTYKLMEKSNNHNENLHRSVRGARSFFENYLYLNGNTDNQNQSAQHEKGTLCKQQVSAESRVRKPRHTRRHTVAGTERLTVEEIENWISEKKEESQLNTKDDCEIQIAKPKFRQMRRAQTLNSFEWRQKRENQSKKEKSKRRDYVFNQLPYESKCPNGFSSCMQVSADVGPKKSIANGIATNFNYDKPLVHLERTYNDQNQLFKNGLNDRLSCFLTPRPYKKDSVVLNQTKQASRSTSLHNITTFEEDENMTSEEDLNGNAQFSLSASYSNYIIDDDEFPNGYSKFPKSQSKYDTFLDLSKLDLDNESDSSSISSNFGNPLSLSDSEAMISNKWEEFKQDGSLNKKQISLSQSGFTEDFTESVSVVNTREPLQKIEEEVFEEDESKFDDSTDTNMLAKKEKTITLRTTATLQCNLEKNLINLGDQATKTEPKVNEKETVISETHSSECIQVITQQSTDIGLKDCVDLVPNDTSSTRSSLITTTPSTSSDYVNSDDGDDPLKASYLNGIDVFDSHSVDSKSASLDRYKFKKLSAEEPSHDSTVKPNCNKSAQQNSSHVGLKRLFRIAVSTVNGNKSVVQIKDLLEFFQSKGIKLTDPRLQEVLKKIKTEEAGKETALTIRVLSRICEPCHDFFRMLLLSQVTIPGFGLFKLRMTRIFENIEQILHREIKTEVLAEVDPCSSYNVIMRKLRTTQPVISMSVCTVDGQRCSFGNQEIPHPLNACATVFNYCLACRQNGIETVSRFFSHSTQSRDQNEFSLAKNESVRNPFCKSGSILTSALLFREMAIEKRIEALHHYYRELIGQESLCCDNLSYNYKRIYDHEEIGLAYFLSATQRLPRGTSVDLADFLDFHFQASSSAMTSDACAIGAATIANGGICSVTDSVVLDETCIDQTLLELKSSFGFLFDDNAQDIVCAMNENGSLLIIIPGVLGLSCFLQCQSRNTIQTICEYIIKELTQNFNFSVYRSLRDKRDLTAR